MFKVGDYIVYPMHGAGKIKSLEEKEISGKKQQYYTIDMLIGDMKVMIPETTIAKTKIRPVEDLAAVKEIASMVQGQEREEKLTWKKRHKANMDKIESGSLQACAEVVYNLLRTQREDKLNSSERRVLKKAKAFLMSELKLVEGMNENKKEKFMSMMKEETPSAS